MTQYVIFKQEEGEDEVVLNVENKYGQHLGQICEYKVGRKKKYCFFPDPYAKPEDMLHFTWECMIQIGQKCKELEGGKL